MPEAMAKRAPRLLKRQRIREGTIAYIERTTGRRARLGRDRITARLATKRKPRRCSSEMDRRPCW